MTLTRRQTLLAFIGAAVAASQADKLPKVLALPPKSCLDGYMVTFSNSYAYAELTEGMVQAAKAKFMNDYGAPDILVVDPKVFAALQRDLSL